MRCSPATDPEGPDRRPGEEVWEGVDLIGITSKPPVAQRVGGIMRNVSPEGEGGVANVSDAEAPRRCFTC